MLAFLNQVYDPVGALTLKAGLNNSWDLNVEQCVGFVYSPVGEEPQVSKLRCSRPSGARGPVFHSILNILIHNKFSAAVRRTVTSFTFWQRGKLWIGYGQWQQD